MSSAPQSTREKILKATRDLIEARQGQGVRMSDIAKAAGVSRQALYLHFDTRADLLIATARFVDETLEMDRRLIPSRTAMNGRERIAAFIAAWADWVPEIRNMATALLSMSQTDPEAAAAWADRMEALRQGCEAAIRALEADGALNPAWTVDSATQLFWVMLSFPNWQTLTETCGWTSADYADRLTRQALATFAI